MFVELWMKYISSLTFIEGRLWGSPCLSLSCCVCGCTHRGWRGEFRIYENVKFMNESLRGTDWLSAWVLQSMQKKQKKLTRGEIRNVLLGDKRRNLHRKCKVIGRHSSWKWHLIESRSPTHQEQLSICIQLLELISAADGEINSFLLNGHRMETRFKSVQETSAECRPPGKLQSSDYLCILQSIPNSLKVHVVQMARYGVMVV